MGADIKASGPRGFFISGGGGVEYGSVDDSHRGSPYIDVGGGWEHRLLPDLSLRLEASYRLLSNAGNRGGFGGELWAGAGVVVDLPGRWYREMPPLPERSVEVVPVRCAAPPEGLLVNGDGELVAQDSRTIAVDFATNSATLDAASQAEIASLATALLCGTAQQLAVQVVGHADVRGDAVYNVKLSQRRADAVRDALIADGVSTDRISIDAAGKYEPLKKGNNAAVNALNRKIEIKLYSGVVPE
jgi:OOP family OmpA-OmpF porin